MWSRSQNILIYTHGLCNKNIQTQYEADKQPGRMSQEVLNTPLLDLVGRKQKPMALSTNDQMTNTVGITGSTFSSTVQSQNHPRPRVSQS